MAENTQSARCSEQEFNAARDAGLMVVTTADEAAIHKFATAMRADLIEEMGLAADTLDNLLAALTLPMPAQFHLDCLRPNLESLRDKLRAA